MTTDTTPSGQPLYLMQSDIDRINESHASGTWELIDTDDFLIEMYADIEKLEKTL